MNTELTTHGKTCLTVTRPWGLFVKRGSRVLCSDGKVRGLAYLAQTPDTFFSTPAAVRVLGHYVHGYVTVDEQKYWDGKKDGPWLNAYTFRQHDGQNGILPPWPNALDETEKFNALIAGAQ